MASGAAADCRATGPDRCTTIPRGGPWKDWTRYSVRVTPDPTSVETRLYLYGLRDLNGQRRQAQVHRAAEQVGLLGFFRVSLVRLGRHADGRVRQRELGVDVEMYEAGVGHAGPGWSAQAPGADAGIVAGVGKRWSARSG